MKWLKNGTGKKIFSAKALIKISNYDFFRLENKLKANAVISWQLITTRMQAKRVQNI